MENEKEKGSTKYFRYFLLSYSPGDKKYDCTDGIRRTLPEIEEIAKEWKRERESNGTN